MAFKPIALYAIAHQTPSARLLAVEAPRTVDADQGNLGSFALTGAVLKNGSGATLGGTFHTMFSITAGADPDGTGTTTTATLSFNRQGFDAGTSAAAIASRARLIEAFATGGLINFAVSVTDNNAGTTSTWHLPVRLGALLTSDFIVDGGVATPAHYDTAAPPATNLGLRTLGAGESYTYSCPAVGASPLTVSSAGVITVTAAAPPVVVDTVTLEPSSSTFNLPLSIRSQIKELDGINGAHPTATLISIDQTSVLPVDLHLLTQCIITIDRSGSMGATTPTGSSKWDEAVKAATLFSSLYGGAVPDHATPNSNLLVDQYFLQHGRWRWLTGAFSVEYQPTAFAAASAQTAVTTGLTPNGGTPIGQALMDAKALFTSGAWRRRHLILLTDGMDNSGSPTLAQVYADNPGHLPTLDDATNAANAVIVHTVSYALAGDVPVINLHDLAKYHGGVFLGSEADSDAYDVNKLRDRFLNALSRVLPVELATNVVGDATFDVEEGVERVIFVGTDDGAGAVALSATGPGTDATNAAGSLGGTSPLLWASADDPEPGLWTVSGASAGQAIYAIYDVSLRMEHEIQPRGVGQPVKVRARLHYRGEPVTGADVWLGLRRPGESIGQVITSFVQRRGLGRAVFTRKQTLLHPDLAAMLAARESLAGRDKVMTAAIAARGVSTPSGDTKSLQRLLLEAAERDRNLELQNLGNAIQLVEVSPGTYEGEVPATLTQEEGVYDFAFLARGTTAAGNDFKRTQRRSIALSPIPSAATSEGTITQAPRGQHVVWTATVLPRTATKRALGPGLGYALGFHYASEADRKKLAAPITIDNLDGTYSTHIELNAGERLPPLVLVLGKLGADLSNGIPVEDTRRPRHVRVRLEKIQILDDHDGCLTGDGELVFDTFVAPNGNPTRAVQTRLPARGALKVSSGQAVKVDELIYDGLVEAGASLAVTIGGRELDYFLFFRREEKLARYHRVLPLKSAKLAPGDEPNDPESLRDWKVWYTVEVE